MRFLILLRNIILLLLPVAVLGAGMFTRLCTGTIYPVALLMLPVFLFQVIGLALEFLLTADYLLYEIVALLILAGVSSTLQRFHPSERVQRRLIYSYLLLLLVVHAAGYTMENQHNVCNL